MAWGKPGLVWLKTVDIDSVDLEFSLERSGHKMGNL